MRVGSGAFTCVQRDQIELEGGTIAEVIIRRVGLGAGRVRRDPIQGDRVHGARIREHLLYVGGRTRQI